MSSIQKKESVDSTQYVGLVVSEEVLSSMRQDGGYLVEKWNEYDFHDKSSYAEEGKLILLKVVSNNVTRFEITRAKGRGFTGILPQFLTIGKYSWIYL